MQIADNVRWCIIFQNRFHLFIVYASFFHFALCLFAEIDFCAVHQGQTYI